MSIKSAEISTEVEMYAQEGSQAGLIFADLLEAANVIQYKIQSNKVNLNLLNAFSTISTILT